MTTAADVIRVAEEVRAAGLVYRQANGYVSIQQQPPYDAASGNDRFGTSWVEHCGITVAFILTRAGLVFGRDYPESIQYSVSLARDLLAAYDTGEPEPGFIGVIDWGRAGWGATGYSDHVVLIVENRGNTLVCLDANTTEDGRLYYHEYPRSYFTAWGRPRYTDTPSEPDWSGLGNVIGTVAALSSI